MLSLVKTRSQSRMLVFSVGLLIGLCQFTGCVKYPSVSEIGAVKVLRADAKTITVETEVQLENPNGFAIDLTQMEYAMYAHGQALGSGLNTQNLTLPPKGTAAPKMQVQVDLKTLESLLPTLLEEEQTQITIMGNYSFLLLKKEWTLQAENEVEVETSEILSGILDDFFEKSDLQVENMNQVGIGLTKTRIHFDLTLTNSLPFDFTLQKITANLYKNGEKLGRSATQASIPLTRDQTISIPMQVTVSNLHLLAQAPDLLNGEGFNEGMILKGEATLTLGESTFTIPFQVKMEEISEDTSLPLPKLPKIPLFRRFRSQ